ncbi:MAG: hypothetical protein JXR37_34135 [Kiritimatiellae bacterium]|nr:hypothetical protein [Kiritimatiellia bacterium]
MTFRIPMPLQVVVDDVGWWCGEDGHARQEPFRSGIGRTHVPADYAALVSLGRQLGIRPMAAMVLCEWDRANILRRVPSATWMGSRWDNSRWVGAWLDEAAEILRQGAPHVELALHGVGHEYWEGGTFTRAEWHDGNGAMRPRDDLRQHLEAFAAIQAQNGLGPFPESFVPAAFRHAIGDGPAGLAALLGAYGVRRIATPCSVVRAGRTFEHPLFTADENVFTVLQPQAYRYPWLETGVTPVHELAGPLVGTHWPNLLHADPARNEEVVARWVAFLRPYENRADRLLAPDSRACFTQLAHHALAQIAERPGMATIDVSRVRRLAVGGLQDTFAVRIDGQPPPGLTWAGASVAAQRAIAPACHEWRLRVTAANGVATATWPG